ncbi:membrane lipoprotein lipid attachment site-containing protein [Alkalibacillus haloalkaliphilus]|uniref:Lipocalin-like domain-containing protein n=1 Tax=Alkalibacillus haloalkaliphilus TaxID=94136 RepID=A0A511W3C1_9BACI|nr:membrane lipoprotein lipid attachment site-containing protein [Alkalibacillus haloalkaliphilus]GEN45579.1 hypothetical protein AHA02nite_13550 [Alkalibacillus haloalkaliphilus]
MKKIIVLLVAMLVLAACQNNGEEDAGAIEQPENLDEALVDFQDGDPTDEESYLGAWLTYQSDEESYEILRIEEEDGEYHFNYNEVGSEGRLLQDIIGVLDEFEDGYGLFEYDSDRFGSSGQFELFLEEDGIHLVQAINLENRDETAEHELFFDKKLER